MPETQSGNNRSADRNRILCGLPVKKNVQFFFYFSFLSNFAPK